MQTSILIIYTGGTIGMISDAESGKLSPFDFQHILDRVPELKRFRCHISSVVFEKPLDSSNMNIDAWKKITQIIFANYSLYDGFVILHGTDTMAFTASALSFMLDNLSKPVILTGSQLPIGTLRTDGKENLITAIEIAAAKKNKKTVVPEVSILFENRLMRGNRTTKHNADHFDAIYSYNYPDLAKIGIDIIYNTKAIMHTDEKRKIQIHTELNTDVAILKIFPGIKKDVLQAFFNIPDLKAVVLETYGSGNAPTDKTFINEIKKAIKKDIIIYNVTQCRFGRVDMKQYETGRALLDIGVVGGNDITVEAAVTKLMHLLGQKLSLEQIKILLSESIKGEIT